MFFFQAEDGIRDAQESRGLGDVYKRQSLIRAFTGFVIALALAIPLGLLIGWYARVAEVLNLSLIHI